MRKLRLLCQGMMLAMCVIIIAWSNAAAADCKGLPTQAQLQAFLVAAPSCAGCTASIISDGTTVGGLFNGTRMWGAVVNRDGEVCAYVTSKADPTQVWPGSQAIAKAKAYTANAFSLDSLA